MRSSAMKRRLTATPLALLLATAGVAHGQVQRTVVARHGQAVSGGGTLEFGGGYGTLGADGSVAFEAAVHARPDGADGGVVYASGGLLHLLTAPHLFGGDLSKAGMEAGDPTIDR